MEHLKNKFLEDLGGRLWNHDDKDSLLREYECHIDALIQSPCWESVGGEKKKNLHKQKKRSPSGSTLR